MTTINPEIVEKDGNMKTGRVAKLFQRDPKTVMKWADLYRDYFTPEARGAGGSQREFGLDDLIAINTVRTLVGQRLSEQTIKERLASGYRETSLPPEFATLEGEKAIAVYAEMSSIQAENKMLLREREEWQRERTGLYQTNSQLNQEVGKWKALYEMLKEQGDKLQ